MGKSPTLQSMKSAKETQEEFIRDLKELLAKYSVGTSYAANICLKDHGQGYWPDYKIVVEIPSILDPLTNQIIREYTEFTLNDI